MLVVDVLGIPRPQPRPRVGAGGAVSTTGPAKRWKVEVERAVREAVELAGWKVLAGPARLSLVFRFPTPEARRWFKPRAMQAGPDWDNTGKLVGDVLTACGVWDDDGRVCDAQVRQVWVPPALAGCWVEVEAVGGEVWPWAEAAWGGLAGRRSPAARVGGGGAPDTTKPACAGSGGVLGGVPGWLA